VKLSAGRETLRGRNQSRGVSQIHCLRFRLLKFPKTACFTRLFNRYSIPTDRDWIKLKKIPKV